MSKRHLKVTKDGHEKMKARIEVPSIYYYTKIKRFKLPLLLIIYPNKYFSKCLEFSPR